MKLLVNEKGEWVIGDYHTHEGVEYFKLHASFKPIIETDEFEYEKLFTTTEEIRSYFTLKVTKGKDDTKIISNIFKDKENSFFIETEDQRGFKSKYKLTTDGGITFQLESRVIIKSVYKSELTGEFSLDWKYIFNNKPEGRI